MVLWAAFTVLLLWVADLATSAHSAYEYVALPAYKYAPYAYVRSPPLPLHRHHLSHVHKHAPEQPKRLKVAVTHVYCDACKDGKVKEPLKGVIVGVLCWTGEMHQSFYGTTNKLGNFKVKLGGYHYHKHHGGTKSCRVKLISPSHATSCTVATDLHGGKLGAPLQIKSETLHEVVFKAGPFAYTSSLSKNKQCDHYYGKPPSIYKHDPKPSSKHSHLHVKYESSCPAYKCKTTTPPSNNSFYAPYKGIQSITSKHKSPHSTYKGLAPKSLSPLYPPPQIFLRYRENY